MKNESKRQRMILFHHCLCYAHCPVALDGGGRATRRATQRVSSSSTAPREEDTNVFGRLRGTVDSDESGDEEITSKQTMGTTMDKGDNQETRKKRRRLDSSSEDDDDDDNFV